MPARPTDQTRPYRSVLYIPGANERALEKAKGLAADAIIFDLEDAVSPEEKAGARAILAGVLRKGGYGRRARIVRVNGLDTPWARDDIAALAGVEIDALLIPKVGSAADVEAVAQLAPDVGLWAMMESPAGMLRSAEIAAHPRLTGMVMGTNDLAKDLGARFRTDRMPMLAGLQLCLLAARAEGIVIVDGVYNAFRDEDGLRAECVQGRDMGFDGKTLIHPAQLAIANDVFAPSCEEIDLARRQIDAYEAARAEGRGVAVLDGRIVENLHAAAARQMLARAGAIAEMAR
jgi:(3S)-malyl-CoA thioesterase